MSTPWGTPDRVITIEPGLCWVSTPSHGGFRVSNRYAERHLSEEAIDVAIKSMNNIYFEEDCNASVVIWELEDVDFTEIFVDRINRDEVFQSLSYWNRGYVVARGWSPTTKEWSCPKQEHMKPRSETCDCFPIPAEA